MADGDVVPDWIVQRISWTMGLAGFLCSGEEGPITMAPFIVAAHQDGRMAIDLENEGFPGNREETVPRALEALNRTPPGQVWRGLVLDVPVGDLEAVAVTWHAVDGSRGRTAATWARDQHLQVRLRSVPIHYFEHGDNEEIGDHQIELVQAAYRVGFESGLSLIAPE